MRIEKEVGWTLGTILLASIFTMCWTTVLPVFLTCWAIIFIIIISTVLSFFLSKEKVSEKPCVLVQAVRMSATAFPEEWELVSTREWEDDGWGERAPCLKEIWVHKDFVVNPRGPTVNDYKVKKWEMNYMTEILTKQEEKKIRLAEEKVRREEEENRQKLLKEGMIWVLRNYQV